MIDDLDKVLRQLLLDELKNGKIKIELKPPLREWTNNVTQPTLNLFLHDIRENRTLRQGKLEYERNGNGGYHRQRAPVILDVYYLITAWAKEPEDEHLLLTRTLAALFRNPTLPEHLLPESLQDQPRPIQVSVAQYDLPHKLTDIWSVLENDMRPGIDCRVTLALNPVAMQDVPMVTNRDLRFGQAEELPKAHKLSEPLDQQDRLWMVGGTIFGVEAPETVRLTLLERGLDIPVKPNGRFIIGNLEAETYTLTASVGEGKPSQHKLIVPSGNYDIKL